MGRCYNNLTMAWRSSESKPCHQNSQIQIEGTRQNGDVRVSPNRFVCKIGHPWNVLGCIVLVGKFSSPTDPNSVVFSTVPLWMSFRGLLLEHCVRKTVKKIAKAAGILKKVLPKEVLPRAAEGFRALVDVDINKPLLQGVDVNTLAMGTVWIKFTYNNPPINLLCSLCHRLGHDLHSCNFEEQPNLMNEKFDQVVPVWPHKQMGLDPIQMQMEVDIGAPLQQPDNSQMGLNEEATTDVQCATTMKLWTEMGLIDHSELRRFLQAQARNNSAIGNPSFSLNMNITEMSDIYSCPQNSQLSPGIENPIRQGGIVIQEQNTVTTIQRRRGRPLGATNKQKGKVEKGKSVSVYEDNLEVGKKRKIMKILEMERNMIPFITEPPLVQTVASPSPISLYNQPIAPDPQNLELAIQLLLKLEIANLLVAQGIVSPHIFNFIPNTVEPVTEVENHISPALVMPDPFMHYEFAQNMGNFERVGKLAAHLDVHMENEGYDTYDPNGGVETRSANVNQNSVIPVAFALLYLYK